MKKKVLSILLCLVMVIGLLPTAALAATEVNSAEALAAALNEMQAGICKVESDGKTVTMLKGITLTDTISITAGAIVLDLNGKTITGKADCNAISVSGDANVTIQDDCFGGVVGGGIGGGIVGGSGRSALAVSDGKVILSGGFFQGGSEGGKAISGTIAIATDHTVRGGEAAASTTVITEDYDRYQYVVVLSPVQALTAALNEVEKGCCYNGGENRVRMSMNVTLTDTIEITAGTIRLDLDGCTITGAAGGDGSTAISVSGTADLSVYDSTHDQLGKIVGGSGSEGGNGGSALSVSGGTVFVNSGSFTGGSGGTNGGDGLSVSGSGSVTLSGGTLTGGSGGTNGGNGLSVSGSGSVTLSGGSFTGGSGSTAGKAISATDIYSLIDDGCMAYDDKNMLIKYSDLATATDIRIQETDLATSVIVGGVTLNSRTPYWKNGDTQAAAGTADDWNAKFEMMEEETILTLKDAVIAGAVVDEIDNVGIYADGHLTVTLEGSSTVTGGAANSSSCGIECGRNLTINGTGSLTAVGGAADYSCGVYADWALEISGDATVTAVGGAESEFSNGLSSSEDDITISGGRVTAVGKNIGVGGDVIYTGGLLVAKGGTKAMYRKATGSGVSDATLLAGENDGSSKYVVFGDRSTYHVYATNITSANTDKDGIEWGGDNLTLTNTIIIGEDSNTHTAALTFSKDGKLTSNGFNVVLAGDAGVLSCSIAGDGSIAFSGSANLTAIGGSGGSSYGVYAVGTIALGGGSGAAIGATSAMRSEPTATGVTTTGAWDGKLMTWASHSITATEPANGSFTVTVDGAEVTSAGAGKTVTITPTAASGYVVDAVTVTKTGDTNTVVTVSNNTFTMPAYPVTVTVTFKTPTTPSGDDDSPTVYPITEGAGGKWAQGTDGSLAFRSTGSFSSFRSVTVDGKTIEKDADYTVAAGSTLITLKPAYLATLAVGEHTLRVRFTGGYSETTFTIEKSAPWVNPFTDVAERDWFCGDVAYVAEKGLMRGTEDTIFSPYITTTRGMIVTILYRLEGEPAVTGASPFDDVAAGKYYSSAVIWAAANNIVEGYGDGKFGPADNITREQLAAILYRYAAFKGYDVTAAADLSKFSDESSISGYAVAAIGWAHANGIVDGKGDGILNPGGEALRCEAAAILHRFCARIV